MLDLGRSTGLLVEPLLEDLVFAELALQHLERDHVATVVHGSKDEPHRPLAEQRLEVIFTELVSALQLACCVTS